jgi:hypothetical protein
MNQKLIYCERCSTWKMDPEPTSLTGKPARYVCPNCGWTKSVHYIPETKSNHPKIKKPDNKPDVSIGSPPVKDHKIPDLF